MIRGVAVPESDPVNIASRGTEKWSRPEPLSRHKSQQGSETRENYSFLLKFRNLAKKVPDFTCAAINADRNIKNPQSDKKVRNLAVERHA